MTLASMGDVLPWRVSVKVVVVIVEPPIGSENVAVTLAPAATPVAFAAGLVAPTVGGVVSLPPFGASIRLETVDADLGSLAIADRTQVARYFKTALMGFFDGHTKWTREETLLSHPEWFVTKGAAGR